MAQPAKNVFFVVVGFVFIFTFLRAYIKKKRATITKQKEKYSTEATKA
jgi:hypothetical protein